MWALDAAQDSATAFLHHPNRSAPSPETTPLLDLDL